MAYTEEASSQDETGAEDQEGTAEERPIRPRR